MRVLTKVSDNVQAAFIDITKYGYNPDENVYSSQEYWYDATIATVGQRRFMRLELLNRYLIYFDLTKDHVTDALSYLYDTKMLDVLKKIIGSDNYIRLRTFLDHDFIYECSYDHPTKKVLIIEQNEYKVSIIKFDTIKDAKRFVSNDTDEAFLEKYPECLCMWRNCEHYYI